MSVMVDTETDFGELLQRHRRELHVHCYRMLGSFEEAEDLVQETFLRAWNKRDQFEGGPLFRAWLYKIATNACLDAIRKRNRQVPALQSFAEVPWLQPYPDVLLDELTPEAAALEKETISLAYLATIQLLPARQRAVLIMREVLGWSAQETGSMLELSVAAVNSALQRARATLREHLPADHTEWSTSDVTAEERALLDGFIDTHQRGDWSAAVELMREDIRVTMPPHPFRYDGIAALAPLFEQAFGPDRPGEWLLVPTRANRMPTAATYLKARGDTEFRAFKFDVLRVEHGKIAEITTFGATLFPAFGLPPTHAAG
jgi:RNA polymerase sigma-70 factor (TIGR02960 family)